MTATLVGAPDPEPDTRVDPLRHESLKDRLAALPISQREELLADLPTDVLEELFKDWRFEARDDQIPPTTDYLIWAVVGGRGIGKSRTICEWAHDRMIQHYLDADAGIIPRSMHRFAAGARTAGDGRETLIEGESGLMAVAEKRGLKAQYEPSKRRISWPDINGRATTFSAEEPDQARGPQNHSIIADEFAAWDFSITDDIGNNLWTNLMLGLRLGDDPKAALGTTPKRLPEVREIIANGLDPDNRSVVLSTASTFANAANLSPVFLEKVISKYEGTRLYKQEVLGLLLDDDEDQLWTDQSIMLTHRFLGTPDEIPPFARTVVGVDPPTALSRDYCGIVAVSLLAAPLPGIRRKCIAVRADRSTKGSPEHWARTVVDLCRELGATEVAAEANQGGEMVRSVISNADDVGDLNVHLVRAETSKRLRAEPVAQLYEQRRVAHMDRFGLLETQQVMWVPDSTESPDRLDALVHAVAQLLPAIHTKPSQVSSPSVLSLVRGRQAIEQARGLQMGLAAMRSGMAGGGTTGPGPRDPRRGAYPMASR